MSNRYTTKGYVESFGSARSKSKEDVRISSLIPSEILKDTQDDGTGSSVGIEVLLDAYYRFMNLEEFYFFEDQTFTTLILDDGTATFRIPDPDLENNSFFSQSQIEEQQFITSDNIVIDGNLSNLVWTNGNNIPKILEDGFNKGKTITISGLSPHIGKILTLSTQTLNYRKSSPSSVMNSISEALDIDTADQDFLDMIQKEIASFIPKNLNADKRNLYKKIIEYYKVRGSSESVETFFRLIYNDEVEVSYPYESTLIPSSGSYDTDQNLYLDNKGFLSNTIKLQDSYFYQKFSYVIKTARNISEWEDIFTRLVHPSGFIFFGEILVISQLVRNVLGDSTRDSNDLYPRTNRLTLSSMPGTQPGFIGIEDIALIIEILASSYGQTYTPIMSNNSIQTIIGSPIRTSKYRGIPTITIGEPGFGGTQATARFTLEPTHIESIDIVSSDTYGLSSVPSVLIDAPVSGVQATAVCKLDSNGKVSKITVTNPGSGYVTQPSVTILGVSGSYNVVLSPSRLDQIVITNPGSNYFTPPQIRISADMTQEIRAHQQSVVKSFYHDSNLNYYDRKTERITFRTYGMNLPIKQFNIGSASIKNFSSEHINNINTNSFISIYPSTGAIVDPPVVDGASNVVFGQENSLAVFGSENESPQFGQ